LQPRPPARSPGRPSSLSVLFSHAIGSLLSLPYSLEVSGASYGVRGQGKRRQSVFSAALGAFSSTHWTRSASAGSYRRPAPLSSSLPCPIDAGARSLLLTRWCRCEMGKSPSQPGNFPSPPSSRRLSSLTLLFCPASSADHGTSQIQEQTHTGRPQ
jgi:hypothetical protein